MTMKRDRWTWRRLVLPVSLVLNLFLVALVAGHLVRRQIGELEPGNSVVATGIAMAEASLSKADAAAFAEVMRRDAPRYEPAAKELEQTRQALDRQITSEPFDPKTVRQAFAVWQGAWNRFIDAFTDTAVDALSQISPEGREKLLIQRRRAKAGLPP